MKLEFDEQELVFQIANEIVKNWDNSMKSTFIKYTNIGELLNSKIDKIIADNKEKIINDATKLCADKLQKDMNFRAVIRLLCQNGAYEN